eukprot:COSAG05_NODE_26072_length_191_cov_22.586957_1_plen_48_part_01
MHDHHHASSAPRAPCFAEGEEREIPKEEVAEGGGHVGEFQESAASPRT